MVSAHFQPPFFCFWMTTRTIERQAASPLETFTWPETRLCGWNPNPEIVRATGAVVTVKSAVLVTVPPGVVNEILPVVAVAGTTAVTEVAVFAEKVAVTPLNLTEETPVRFVPVMTTLVPTGPLVGVNDVIVGAARHRVARRATQPERRSASSLGSDRSWHPPARSRSSDVAEFTVTSRQTRIERRPSRRRGSCQ